MSPCVAFLGFVIRQASSRAPLIMSSLDLFKSSAEILHSRSVVGIFISFCSFIISLMRLRTDERVLAPSSPMSFAK